MRIIADENMPLAAELFGDHGQVVRLPGRSLRPADVQEADVLLVRSITRVDASLLAGSRVRFVGSATIGTDHLDTAWLDAQGIAWANAPGCNAEAVAEYVLASLLVLGERDGVPLGNRTVGIIGAGHVGSALAGKLAALGVRFCLNDPPLAQTGRDPRAFVGLDEALACDVVTLHVPLTREGAWPTHHLIDDTRLRQLKPGAILLNASRGGVVDNAALQAHLAGGAALSAVLDVWEGEPAIRRELALRVALATPHIAGYSLDGKLRGTRLIYRACARHFGWEASSGTASLPTQDVLHAVVEDDSETALRQLVLACYDPRRDDLALRASLDEPEPGRAFDGLRKHYPVRREFSAWSVTAPAAVGERLARLGFTVPR